MKGKRILAGLIALVMALSLAACQTGTQTQGQGSVPAGSVVQEESAAAAETVYPVTVTDQAGREVIWTGNRRNWSAVTIFPPAC